MKKAIIIAGIAILLILTGTIQVLLDNNKKVALPKVSPQSEQLLKELNSSKELDSTITSDKIIFSNIPDEIKNNSKVHLWIFSNPLDLGEVTITKNENTYYITSINDILKSKDIKVGNHKILIIKDDKAIGYFNVELTTTKTLKETSKEISNKLKCTPQMFKERYTYYYTDEATCKRNGAPDEVWQYFIKNNVPATIYSCEKIVDDCGDIYYGVYYSNAEGEKFYY